MAAATAIDAAAIDAVIFDLDGVITRTADVHAASWEAMFNDYLAERAERIEEPHRPFTSGDYLEYVDGKPRYDGVASFLRSRGIELPWGDPGDGPDDETVCGLGNRKDAIFHQHLETRGVERFPSSVALVEELQHHGFGTALISSSRNVRAVLAAVGISDLFPVVVGGVEAEALGLPGKPDPAVFLAAASRLRAAPERSVVVEDALSGVEAGRRGGFAMVIGVDRTGQPDELRERGATVVVADLSEVEVLPPKPVPRPDLPSAASDSSITEMFGQRHPAIFLDYDGTLTPIVDRPEDAVLADDTRRVIEDLASVAVVAVLSGRDVDDVRDKLGVGGIYYAGSHGFDIVGPDGTAVSDGRLDRFRGHLASLDSAEGALEERLRGVAGSLVERKRYAIAVHYRRVDPDETSLVEDAVRDVAAAHGELRVTTGKMIFELRPDLDWDKGRALDWLVSELGIDGPEMVPAYIGDDTTDEDAFRAIKWRGVGIVVGRDGDPTYARYALEDPAEVAAFLASMVARERSR